MAFPNDQMPTWAPADEALAVTPSDSVDLVGVPPQGAKLYIGTTGDVTVNMNRTGTDITFKAVPVGWMPILVRRVYTTGTTASNIVAAW